jgi:hypothetical protein
MYYKPAKFYTLSFHICAARMTGIKAENADHPGSLALSEVFRVKIRINYTVFKYTFFSQKAEGRLKRPDPQEVNG